MQQQFSLPSIEGIRIAMKDNRLARKEYILLLALMAFFFIPSVNQLIVDSLITGMGDEVLNIAGQIEWFDLFNETILAFLTVPMYFVFNRARDDQELSGRINSTFAIGFILYALISAIIYIYASGLTAYMNAPDESVTYLRLETIGFVIGFVSTYLFVVFVVRGKWSYIVALLLAKVLMLSIGNMMLIPGNGTTGVAITNISVNLIMSIVSMALLYRERLIRRWSGLDRAALKDWVSTGVFSGGQVFVANLIYVLVVMKMVSEVSQMGNYWLANNFIWGWLLVPMTAIGEMVKREYYNGYNRIWNYLGLTCIVMLVWLISVPLWGMMYSQVIPVENPDDVLGILYKSVPFYVAYAFSTVIQAVLVSVGKTNLIFYECLFVNFVYYGIVYGLYLLGVFEASLDFVIYMFGVGLIVCLIIDAMLYLYSKNSIPDECRPSAE